MRKRKVYYPECMRKGHRVRLDKAIFENDLSRLYFTVKKAEKIRDWDGSAGWNLNGTNEHTDLCNPANDDLVAVFGHARIKTSLVSVMFWRDQFWVRATTGSLERTPVPPKGGRVPATRYDGHGHIINVVLLPLHNKHRIKPVLVASKMEASDRKPGTMVDTLYFDSTPTDDEVKSLLSNSLQPYSGCDVSPDVVSRNAKLVRIQGLLGA